MPCNTKHNTVGEAILISDKLNFKIKTITRDQEGHFIKRKNQFIKHIK